MKLKSLIPSSVAGKLARSSAKLNHASPKIFFVGGVAGMVGTAVLASRATLKVEGVITETQRKMTEIKEMQHETYSEEDRLRDRVIVLSRAFTEITKLYAPAVIVGGISILLLTKSHNILTKRNAALAAAYAAVDKGFREYRNRVIEDLGEDTDRKYLRNIQRVEYTETDEDGTTRVVKEDKALSSTMYGRLFHEGNPNWQRVPEYNVLFLRGMQNMLNDQLKAKGFLLLNDVYDELGFDRSEAGCVVGWLRDGEGDGYVDFGIFGDDLRMFDYVIGREGEIHLDFNVDGIVYDQIGR